MSRTDETEVLVVGAGPVGMVTALLLAEKGIQVKVIDKEYRTASHSYACVLHPATLHVLDQLGLGERVCALGRPIDTAAFYEGESRCAEIKFTDPSGEFAHGLVLPQNLLEEFLEVRFLAKHRPGVLWNHRLSDLRFENDTIVASIDKLAQTAKGYMAAEWDWVVQKRLETRAAFVVGADGHDSIVRSRLGIEYEDLGGSEQFAVFEFESDDDPGNEVRIAMDDLTTNVLWPLPGGRCRWTFQLVKAVDTGEFPEKDREPTRLAQLKVDEQMRRAVERLARNRAPWFKGNVKDIPWSARVSFGRRLARQFGKRRAWLAGDAAHQTGPVGGQSMNSGLLEAADLANLLVKILRERAPLSLLENHNRIHRARWEQLLDRKGTLAARVSNNPWVKARAARILPCIPASGEALPQLLSQLGFASETAATAR